MLHLEHQQRILVTGQLLDLSSPDIIARELVTSFQYARASGSYSCQQFGEFSGEIDNSGDLQLTFASPGARRLCFAPGKRLVICRGNCMKSQSFMQLPRTAACTEYQSPLGILFRLEEHSYYWLEKTARETKRRFNRANRLRNSSVGEPLKGQNYETHHPNCRDARSHARAQSRRRAKAAI